MSDTQRAILEKVAAGELSPEDAAARLRDMDEQPDSPATEAPAEPAGPVTAVRLVGSFQQTKVIGDPSVRGAVAEGRHVVRTEGGTMVISADEGDGGHVHESSGKGFSYSFSFADGKAFRGKGARPEQLTIRMNPALALQAQLAAGSLSVDGVTGPIDAQVSAGVVRIDGFASPIKIQVAGGVVNATGRLDHGDSQVTCEAGKVHIALERGSSVAITGRAGLGKVELPGNEPAAVIGGGTYEATVGDGAGRLHVEASLGLIAVEAR